VELEKLKEKTQEKEGNDFHSDKEGLLCFRGRCCVSNQEDIKQEILAEAHQSKFSMHSEETKIYKDMKRQFWWNGMKKDISQFVARFLTCQRVKAKHKRSGGLLQPLPVP
jgi:hypothetical protein